ncbi:molybdenum cofactor guanylyltransferase MobA [Mesorhizobium sp. KR9-304]|uniref:molybdenum cofactor guanylyltransferase MobA n=1 Tax=Mesorhizobium sp. KR9-304 TaxID=3156614 RepID=UPI0032B4E478
MTRSRGIAGLVLAGGRATRFGGGDKPLRLLARKTMLAHVLDRLEPQVAPLAISANGDPARFAQYGLPVLADDGAGRQTGPLAGILSGMAWAAAETGCARVLTVAGDTPFFPRNLAARLSQAVAGLPGNIAVAASGGRRHPVFALWPVSLATDLRDFLAGGANFSVAAFLDKHQTVSVDFPMGEVKGARLDPFFNVNTPEDLAEAEAIVLGGKP